MRSQRGAVMMEFLIGVAVVSSLSLVLVRLFQAAQKVSLSTSYEASVIKNARKVVGGEANFAGIAWDVQASSGVTAVSATSLALRSASGSVSTYTVTAAGELRTTVSGTTKTRATGLSSVAFTYYARDSNYLVYETTQPADAVMVGVSYSVNKPGHTVAFYSGASMRNTQK